MSIASNKQDFLYKKNLGVVNSQGPAISYQSETAGNARPRIISNLQLFSQPIPQNAPTDLGAAMFVNLDGTILGFTDFSGLALGSIRTSVTYPYIQYVDKLKLSPASKYAYYFNNPGVSTNINLLSNAIPYNYNPSNTTWAYTVTSTNYPGGNVDPSLYIVDTDAGYLYFVNTTDWTPYGTPYISFYRYNGTIGIPTNIGNFAGAYGQGSGAIAFGNSAGSFNQGTNSIAIGAFAGPTGLTANSIVLNASGTGLAGTGPTGGFYVAPIASYSGSTGPFMLLAYGTDRQIVSVTGAALTAMNIGGGGGGGGSSTDGNDLVLQTANPGIITLNPGGGGIITHKFTSSQYRLTAGSADDSSIAFVDEAVSLFPSWRLSREVGSNRLIFRDSSSVIQLALSNYVSVPVSLRLPYLTAHATYQKCLIIAANSANLDVIATDTPTFTGVTAVTFQTPQSGLIETNTLRSTAGQLTSTLVINAYDIGGPGSYSSIGLRLNNVSKLSIVDAGIESFVTFQCPTLRSVYGLFEGLSNAGQIRMTYGNYGVMMRNDGGSFFFLLTNSGDPYGGWNGLRPFYIDLASGNLYSNNAQRFCTTGNAVCATSIMHGTTICPNNPSNWDLYGLFVGADGSLPGPAGFNNQSPGLGIGYDRQYNPGHCRIIALQPSIQWKELHFGAHIHVFWTFGVNLCGYVNSGGFVSLSDGRVKRDVRPIKTARSLERVLRARPVTYRRIMPDDDKMIPDSERLHNHIGLIAQDVREFNPHAVDDSASNEKQEYLGIRYNDFVIHLIGAVQELHKKLALTEEKLSLTEEKLASTDAKLALTDAKLVSTEEKLASTDAKLASLQLSALEARLAAQERVNELQQEQINRLVAALPNAFNVIV